MNYKPARKAQRSLSWERKRGLRKPARLARDSRSSRDSHSTRSFGSPGEVASKSSEADKHHRPFMKTSSI